MLNAYPLTPQAKINFAAKVPDSKTARKFVKKNSGIYKLPKFIKNILSGRLTNISGTMLNKNVKPNSFRKNFAENPKVASDFLTDRIFSMGDFLVWKII